MMSKKLLMVCCLLAILLLVGCKQRSTTPISVDDTPEPVEEVDDVPVEAEPEEDLTAKDILKGSASLDELDEEEQEGTGVLAVLDNSEPKRTSTWEQYGYYGTLNEEERKADEAGKKGGFRRTLKDADVPDAPEVGS